MNKNEQDETTDLAIFPELHFNEDNKPYASVAGHMHHALAELIAAHPKWGRADRLSCYCGLVLHFHPGPGCVLIEDADAFRTRYRDLRQAMRPAGRPRMNVRQIPPPTKEQAAPPGAPPPLDPAWKDNRSTSDDAKLAQADEPLFLQPVRDDTTPADFGPFDLSELAPPRIEQDKLIFYAEQTRYCIPCRVEAPWPASQEGEVNFMLLPLLHDSQPD